MTKRYLMLLLCSLVLSCSNHQRTTKVWGTKIVRIGSSNQFRFCGCTFWKVEKMRWEVHTNTFLNDQDVERIKNQFSKYDNVHIQLQRLGILDVHIVEKADERATLMMACRVARMREENVVPPSVFEKQNRKMNLLLTNKNIKHHD